MIVGSSGLRSATGDPFLGFFGGDRIWVGGGEEEVAFSDRDVAAGGGDGGEGGEEEGEGDPNEEELEGLGIGGKVEEGEEEEGDGDGSETEGLDFVEFWGFWVCIWSGRDAILEEKPGSGFFFQEFHFTFRWESLGQKRKRKKAIFIGNKS